MSNLKLLDNPVGSLPEQPIQARTLPVVTGEIRLLQGQFQQLALGYAIEIGRRLTEAKALVPYGGWGEYLKTETEYSQSTAQNLMRVFEGYGSEQQCLFGAEVKSQTFGNLTYSKALELLAIPSAEREDFVAEHDVENMSTRMLKEAIRARDEALAANEAAQRALSERVDEETTRTAALTSELELLRSSQSGLEEEAEDARLRADSLERLGADLKRELEELRAASTDGTGNVLPDEAALEAARQAGASAAKQGAEAALEAKISKLKADKTAAEERAKKLKEEKVATDAKLQALQEEQRLALEAAERRREQEAGRAAALEKQLAVAGNQEVASFRFYFEAI